MMQILVRASSIQPGDCWTEHDKHLYVVYENLERPDHRRLKMILVENGQPSQIELCLGPDSELLVNRFE